MADIIIILIVIILLGLALKVSIKHFKGEGPCCEWFRKPTTSKNKVFRRSGDWQKNVEDFRNALRALCEYRNKCIEWIGRGYCKLAIKDNSAEVSYDREIDLTDLKNAVKKQE